MFSNVDGQDRSPVDYISGAGGKQRRGGTEEFGRQRYGEQGERDRVKNDTKEQRERNRENT